jgi:hypothetical protein
VRKALFASDDAADLQPEHIAIHMPGAAVVRPKTKAH